MKVLKIEKVKFKKNAFKIFFDSGISIIILGDTIVKFSVKTGIELSDEEYKDMKSYDKSGRIMSDALALLALRSYSSKVLQDKLLKKGYDKNMSGVVIKRLEELNYINDDRFSKNYAFCMAHKGKGEFAIKAELEKHGIDKHLINEALEKVKSQEEPYERIIKIIRLKFKNFKCNDKNELRKTASFFLRRGFSSENIAKAFREYKNNYIRGENNEYGVNQRVG
ncbi:MAG: recombination regulator RecX [Endomicrobium sp.]|jgi:regulatory protein|nr:recombination regulator RecX [Endomicrobium sp.]